MKTQVDAVTVEIVGNLLLSIAEEMGVALIKSAYSTNIKERRDISTAVFDPEGNMVAQAEHVAMHLGSLLGIIKEVYKKHPAQDIRPGDMFMGNDPYNGGGTPSSRHHRDSSRSLSVTSYWLGCEPGPSQRRGR